jgi:transcriptional regulator with XRE-family HTH domain
MELMDIPFVIKALRQAGLTQTQIGKALDLSQTSVSDMEAGKAGTKRPSFAVITGLTRLAKKHRVPLAEGEQPPGRKKPVNQTP